MDLAQEKGSSIWLTSLPIQEFGFALHKQAFQDALALRYNWQPLQAPYACACGMKFSIEHALSCPKGGFPSIQHNEIRVLASMPAYFLPTSISYSVYQGCSLQLWTRSQTSDSTNGPGRI